MRHHPSAGFTLIELVISGALMTLILVSSYLCLSSGISSQKLVETRTEVFQTARVALAIISADLRCACPLSREFDFLGMDRTIGDMEADNLDFGTQNYTPRRPREGDFCEISYYLAQEPESGKYSLWRRRDPSPDDEPLSGGSREEIARGVRGLRFEYYDGFDWYDEWGDPQGKRKGRDLALEPPNMSGLPEAVRITLWFDTETKRLADPSGKNEADEPPTLAFQTVARINLAGAFQNANSSGSATGFPTSGNQQEQGFPQGGPQ